MFEYDEKYEEFSAETDGVKFVCDEVEEGFEELAVRLAECYRNRLAAIADFMLPDIIGMYGEMTREDLIGKLGKPTIDLGINMLFYLEHTLDNSHMIEMEFEGAFENFFCLAING